MKTSLTKNKMFALQQKAINKCKYIKSLAHYLLLYLHFCIPLDSLVIPEEAIAQCKCNPMGIIIQISIIFMGFKLVNYHLSILYISLFLCFLYFAMVPGKNLTFAFRSVELVLFTHRCL